MQAIDMPWPPMRIFVASVGSNLIDATDAAF
jgi:hypothetical protein